MSGFYAVVRWNNHDDLDDWYYGDIANTKPLPELLRELQHEIALERINPDDVSYIRIVQSKGRSSPQNPIITSRDGTGRAT